MRIDGSMIRWSTALCALCAAMATFADTAAAQNVVSDLLGGKLVKPRVGQWVWYDLTDTAEGKRYAVRQAVVGSEKVNRRDGYWVEFEVVPEIGYSLFYKALVTGPTSDPANIHRLLTKVGPEEVREAEIAPDPDAPEPPAPKRRSLGAEDVTTGSGVIRAERLEVTQGDRTFDLWVSDDVRPTGVVRLVTDEGEMVLRSHGRGGEFAKSIVDGEARSPDVEVRVRVTPPAIGSESGSSGEGAVQTPETLEAPEAPEAE